jgi:hypothetical protein
VGVVAATKQSCPFVYSWDGSQYVFDAEPYGGAITRGLEKDDFTQLEQLREQDGLYRLKMVNEVDETQLTNLTELWVVDHLLGPEWSQMWEASCTLLQNLTPNSPPGILQGRTCFRGSVPLTI